MLDHNQTKGGKCSEASYRQFVVLLVFGVFFTITIREICVYFMSSKPFGLINANGSVPCIPATLKSLHITADIIVHESVKLILLRIMVD